MFLYPRVLNFYLSLQISRHYNVGMPGWHMQHFPTLSPDDFGYSLKSYRAASDGQQNYYFPSLIYSIEKKNKTIHTHKKQTKIPHITNHKPKPEHSFNLPTLTFLGWLFLLFDRKSSLTQPNVALHCILCSFN